ncbi:hypotheical protein [Halarchaeum acidiphilum MH1-52-1]|uniref:Hypotheical protein n=1 Tax=Halarchaeum acidiphilum MH1-52-1 TaxID=1261545 RepID=U2YT16_9EURY|nr:hypothetical protein [Halarchaeum acidiphilum]GAD51877.1 hypotheical protein [Halarchaeum acidiphilum MH1-52-1]
MDPRHRPGLAAIGLAVVILALAASFAFVGHSANAAGTSETHAVADGGDTTATRAGRTVSGGSASGDASDAGEHDTDPFALAVRNVSACGSTCRDVSVALTNTGHRTARDVRVDVTITTAGDRIWHDERTVGLLHRNETVTRTEAIDLGYVAAASVQANGGTITVRATVNSSLGTDVITRQRDVA